MTVDLEHMRRTRNARKDAERRKRNALARLRGEPTGLVDAAPIRVHIKALTDLGWSLEAIVHASGNNVTAAGLRLVANGTSQRSERKFLPILDLPITLNVPDSVPDTCFVPSLGATRRIRALMAIGWRHEDISEFIGRASHHIAAGRYPRMTALDWRLVAAAYEKLSAAHGGSAKSRTRANRAGFAPPLAWDDVDDPNENPRRGIRDHAVPDHVVVDRILNGHNMPATKADRLEVIRRWEADGRPLNELDRLTGWNSRRDRRAIA